MNTFLPIGFLGGGAGGGEIILIFVVVLLMFGPKRLPQIARMIGKTLDELRRASQDFKDQIMSIDEPPPVDVDSPEDTYGDEHYDAYGGEEHDDYTGGEGDGFDGYQDHDAPAAEGASEEGGDGALPGEEEGDVTDALDLSLAESVEAQGGEEPPEADEPEREEGETPHGLAG
jgi:TatA/E family protein of Tat protein translocase